jgi:hypothetical protein
VQGKPSDGSVRHCFSFIQGPAVTTILRTVDSCATLHFAIARTVFSICIPPAGTCSQNFRSRVATQYPISGIGAAFTRDCFDGTT